MLHVVSLSLHGTWLEFGIHPFSKVSLPGTGDSVEVLEVCKMIGYENMKWSGRNTSSQILITME